MANLLPPQHKQIRFVFPKNGLNALGRAIHSARELDPVYIGETGDSLMFRYHVRLL
eukprot:m.84099 g.84099  ORF g.84099 m.84099 type:complete len:56 (-) comp12739_c1_seq2:693-860(-)